MTIHAVIWDLGGVLLRTEDFTHRERLAKRLGMNRTELEDLVFSGESGRRAQLGEINIEQHWENVRLALHLSQESINEFQSEFWEGDILDRELVNYIRALRSGYKTGLLSNAFSNLRYVVTQVWKFSDAFDTMIISAELGIMKPNPSIYQAAVESLEVAPEQAVFIDDFLHNVEGARAVNMHAIHFQGPGQTRAELEQLLKGDNR